MSEARYASIVTFVSLSSVIIAGDFSLLSVALPSIGSGLRASPDTLSMIAATSTLVFASCLVLGDAWRTCSDRCVAVRSVWRCMSSARCCLPRPAAP